MRYGVCIGEDFKKIAFAKKCGFDYIESCFAPLGRGSEEKYQELVAAVKENDIKCEVVNCFMPGDLPVAVENPDYDAIREYVERGMSRGEAIGLKKVVYGSGGARKIQDGGSYADTVAKNEYFLREIVAPIAEKYGITVVIEPLCPKDCNIFNTVKESCVLASSVASDNIQTLADLYHMCVIGDTMENIVDIKGSLHHAHIAEPEKRVYPKQGDSFDYKLFIDAIEEAGCETCSIEANSEDWEKDCVEAMAVLKNIK